MVVIVNAVTKKVPKNVYRLVRSFVDSSSKVTYIWNFGVKMKEMITFIKFGKWILKVYITERGLSAELEGKGAKVVYNPDLLLEIYDGKEIVFKAETLERIVATYIESDGPYMEPIPLSTLIEKLDFYIDAVHMIISTPSDQKQEEKQDQEG